MKQLQATKDYPFLILSTASLLLKILRELKKVIPQSTLDYVPNLEKLKPDFVIHGDDWKNGVQKKTRADVIKTLKKWNGKLIEIPYTKGISSTQLNDELKTIGTTPNTRLKRLRRLINAKPLVRILESHSGLTSLIAENAHVIKKGQKIEFDGMWSSSLTDSTSRGKPDIEAVDITTRLHSLNDSLECSTKPFIYDGDTGGRIEHFVFTVRTLERLGISAIIIEDKIGLKKNSLFGTDVAQTQDSIEHFSQKIISGKKAQVTKDFMIIARVESLILGKSVDDAIERAVAYCKAGADGVMIHSKEKTGNDIKKFCKAFRKLNKITPIVVVPSTYNHIKEKEFQNWGVNIVIYANHMLRSSYPAMNKVAIEILKNGRSSDVNEDCMSIKEILELIPGTK